MKVIVRAVMDVFKGLPTAMSLLVAVGVIASASAQQPREAVHAGALKLPEGFQAERLYSVPKEQGSWVSMTTDPKGRLIACDQYGKLYRIDVTNKFSVAPIQAGVGHAQGLLCAFDSLYVVAHGHDKNPAGLYRLKDTNGDDQYNSVEMLRKFDGGGEHGPHAVILSPDKKSLFICAGNHTRLPEVAKSRVTQTWAEDQATPRLPDAGGHAVGKMAPGGWICKTDPDGKEFELISSGFRNEYDIAFDPNGELFTYDADMEWDVGLPWYRPTRVCHVTSGSEFGWRNGSGKWPTWFPDSLPATIDIGPGSPTGVVFGTGAKFPHKYQNAFFIADWSYGVIHAVHLESAGATFAATSEPFCTSTALPVTDLVINPIDGAMYFLIGGRRTQSGLYRVTYQGDQPTTKAVYPAPGKLALLRKEMERATTPLDKLWENLGSQDRFVRFAARTSIEKLPLDDWANMLSDEKDPQTILEATTALARMGADGQQSLAVQSLEQIDWDELDEMQRLHLIRNYSLVLIRLGLAADSTKESVFKLSSHMPSSSTRVNRELARVLASAEAPDVVAKTIDLLLAAKTQEEQIHYAIVLHQVQNGWTRELREKFFGWFLDAAKFQGGNSFSRYLNNIRTAAIKLMPKSDRESLAQLLAERPMTSDPYADLAARPFVKKWAVSDFEEIKESEFENRDLERGRKMFAAGQCFKCHRIAGQGGIVGPDLTNAGRRFNTRDLVETLVDPSKEVSDQYQATVFQLEDGNIVVGRIANHSGDNYMVQQDMINPGHLINVNVNNVEAMKPSTVSMMPTGLLDSLSREEVLDLLAFMKSTSEPVQK